MFKESRLQACQLIESVLLHMPMLNLNRINNIKYILESIDDDGLSCICKIFAVTLSNLDMNEKKYLANGQKRIQQLQLQKQQQQQQQQQQQTQQNGGPTTSAAAASATPNPASSQDQSDQSKNKNQASTFQPIPSLSIRDQNQELLLKIPTLLFRLVNLVRRKDYAVRFTGANSEIEHWIRYIDQALSDTDDNELETTTSANNLNQTNNNFFFNDYYSFSTESMNVDNGSNDRFNFNNISNQPAILAAAKLNNFVYVLYTLSLLLIGKEKKKVQKSLTKLRLASALNSLFDYLIWNCRCEYPNSTSNNSNNVVNNDNNNNNNNNQENNQQVQQQQQAQQPQQQIRSHICPEVAVKIQFLRLVHSFCDHSEYKRVVLSREETEEILDYNRNYFFTIFFSFFRVFGKIRIKVFLINTNFSEILLI